MAHRAGKECLAIVASVAMAAFVLSGAPETMLRAEVHAGGTIRARTSGLVVFTSFEGPLEFEGAIESGEKTATFSAEGSFRWVGAWSLLTLVSEVWVGFEAIGWSDEGDAVDVRGLLYTSRKSLVPLPKGVLLAGMHYTDVWIDGARRCFIGDVSGIVDGGFEPADLPMTVQLAGTGVFDLAGVATPAEECGTPPHEIPFDNPILSEGFLQYLGEFLDLGG